MTKAKRCPFCDLPPKNGPQFYWCEHTAYLELHEWNTRPIEDQEYNRGWNDCLDRLVAEGGEAAPKTFNLSYRYKEATP